MDDFKEMLEMTEMFDHINVLTLNDSIEMIDTREMEE